MATRRWVIGAAGLVCAIGFATQLPAAAVAPSPAQALGLTPIQSLVEYTTPTKDEAAQCTIRPEKENGITSWVVRNKQGEVLRKFADTNSDNVVDEWCYFQNGIEVYRDIDSNFNGKADEYRWFNTAGTRWGIDKNEDGKIDSWKIISPHEVAEQVVFALKTRDQARFDLLLLSSGDLNDLGLGKSRQEAISATVKEASANFAKLLDEQKIVTSDSRYVDFGSAKPGLIPAGTDGSTKDVFICDNSTALIQSGEKHEQVFLGTLVLAGDAWRLIDVPVVGTDNQRATPGFLALNTQGPASAGGEGGPSEEMQAQMKILEDLDKKGDGSTPEEISAGIDQRVDAMQKLADMTQGKDREQWYRQMIDVLSVAIQSGSNPNASERLQQLQQKLTDDKGDDDLISHAMFQGMWARFAADQRQPNADVAKLQDQWVNDLKKFVEEHPKSSDAAEALLQLGFYQEIIGKAEEATKWYQQLVTDFPKARQAERAAGSIRRLTSQGKPMTLRGNDIQGGQIDLAQYRGKVVLIQYWANWCEPCKQDMVLLKDFYAKRGGREFDIVSVCLDNDANSAKAFLAQNKFPWKCVHEPGGLDGRLANEMGVMTLPLMLLVDQNGNVVNSNIHVAELDSELAKLAKPAAAVGAANTLRAAPPKPR